MVKAVSCCSSLIEGSISNQMADPDRFVLRRRAVQRCHFCKAARRVGGFTLRILLSIPCWNPERTKQ
jgi:hypothetical protein